jgi:hypothetical protein
MKRPTITSLAWACRCGVGKELGPIVPLVLLVPYVPFRYDGQARKGLKGRKGPKDQKDNFLFDYASATKAIIER